MPAFQILLILYLREQPNKTSSLSVWYGYLGHFDGWHAKHVTFSFVIVGMALISPLLPFPVMRVYLLSNAQSSLGIRRC